MSARPWFKFYCSDWQADPALQSCSIAARGLWLEMLLLMHPGKPRGHLTLQNGQPIDTEKLASLCRVSFDECAKLVDELRQAKVFSVTGRGVIFSRKMVRDEKKSADGKRTGKRGGNPQLSRAAAPLTEEDNPQWNMASGLSSDGTTSEEEIGGQDGPFTGGEAA